MSSYAATVAFRPLDDSEMARFLDYDVPDDDLDVRPGAPGTLEDPAGYYRDRVASGQYRPGWVWVAERGGEVVGRAAWWGAPDDVRPWSLDWFDPGTGADAVDIGAGLAAAGLKRIRRVDGPSPELHLFLPSDWREDARARAAGERRISAALAGGFRPFLERFGYRWSRADGLPRSSGRLTFREASDDAEVLEALERVLVDTLDGYSLHDIERYGLHEAAKRQLTDLSWFPSPRTWWRLAYDHDGDLVGFIMPARNPMRPVIGYIGVVPEHRGRGYVDDLLAEQTRILAEVMGEDEEIGADTDVDNTPMAAAFARAGYRSVGVRVVMVA